MASDVVAVPVWLANLLVTAIVGCVIAIAGYMVAWNSDDLAFKQVQLERYAQLRTAIDQLQQSTNARLAERFEEAERDSKLRHEAQQRELAMVRKIVDDHLVESRDGYARIRKLEREVAVMDGQRK